MLGPMMNDWTVSKYHTKLVSSTHIMHSTRKRIQHRSSIGKREKTTANAWNLTYASIFAPLGNDLLVVQLYGPLENRHPLADSKTLNAPAAWDRFKLMKRLHPPFEAH